MGRQHYVYEIERRVTRTQPNATTQGDVLCPPELKSRKWKKVNVNVGSIILTRWVPDAPEASEALQQYNTESKISSISTAKRKRSSIGISDKNKRRSL